VPSPQAQALNKQGNLNEYFGVSTGGGVVAPRNRKTYASKRLQQVVNDFREQRRKEMGSGNCGAQDEPSSSSGEDAEAPPPQLPPVAKRGKGRGGSSRGGGKGRGRGGARGTRAGSSRKRKRSVTASSGSDSANGLDLRPPSKTPPPPSGTASRPRARPAFRGRRSETTVGLRPSDTDT
jgi:DNA excision repair protein ERCC-5